jgi:excinuclease ABC subunit C
MAAPFAFDHRAEFLPESSDDLLRSIPAAPGIFALRGADPTAEPYLTRAADLRRRLRRLLAPPEALDADGQPLPSKRLNLRARIHFIEWTRTGSDFESTLLLYRAARSAFGPDEARRRLRLHAPYVLRVTMSNAHPRVYSTNRLSKKSLHESFGPFPSRAAAERYCDAVLDLFLLRRCYEDLEPYPEHPGCVYGEMNKCMQPCKEGNPQACTPEQYAHEAQRVFAFFSTRGQSLLDEVAAQREAASEAMDFEAAATLHKQWEKVRAASLLADELVRPIDQLRALILQEAAPRDIATPGAPGLDSETWASTEPSGSRTEAAAVFLFEHGQLAGPERLSTLGVRAVREQTAVGSSLFAQPLMLAPVPLNEQKDAVILSEGHSPQPKDPEGSHPTQTAASISTTTPEDRARAAIDALTARTQTAPDMAEFCDHLSLLRRWYYRPEKQRTGEVFLPNPDSTWPIRRILNGAARVALGPPAPISPVDREAAKALKTKIIHAGREGVEREVPVLPKRSRSRKAVTPTDLAE